MDFLAKLPNGHSLKAEKPMAAHSLGMPSGSPQPIKRANYHFAMNQQSLPSLPLHQLPKQNQDSPWQTSNQKYGGLAANQLQLINQSSASALSARRPSALEHRSAGLLAQQYGGMFTDRPAAQGNQGLGQANYHSQAVLPTLNQQSQQLNANGIPFNVKVGGGLGANAVDIMQQVNRANNKILYEDPLDRKKREREARIQQERAEMANLQDPFSKLGNQGSVRAIQQRQGALTQASAPPPANPLQHAGLAIGGAPTPPIQNYSFNHGQNYMPQQLPPLRQQLPTVNTSFVDQQIPPPQSVRARHNKAEIATKIGQQAQPSQMNNGSFTLGMGAGQENAINNTSFRNPIGGGFDQALSARAPLDNQRMIFSPDARPQLSVNQNPVGNIHQGLFSPPGHDYDLIGQTASPRSQKPLRPHQQSQIAVAKVHDEFGQQQFQGQKVTNLESGEQMNERFRKQLHQKQILEQQMAEKQAQKAKEKQKELEAELREERRLRDEFARAQHEQYRNGSESPSRFESRQPIVANDNMTQQPVNTSAFNDVGNSNRVLTQKERNLRHAKSHRGATALPKHAAPIRSTSPIGRGFEPAAVRQQSFDDQVIERSPRMQHLQVYQNSAGGSYEGRSSSRPRSGGVALQQQYTGQVISQIENQFKEELNKFKDEMAGHKEDFAKVLDQLSKDAKKTIELRQSAEQHALEAAKERQQEREKQNQIFSGRGAQSAKNIIQYKLLDQKRMEILQQRQQSRDSHRPVDSGGELPNANQFQAIHHQVQQTNQNVIQENSTPVHQIEQPVLQQDEFNDTSKSLVAETQLIPASENQIPPSRPQSIQPPVVQPQPFMQIQTTTPPQTVPAQVHLPSQPMVDIPMLKQPEPLSSYDSLPSQFTPKSTIQQTHDIDTMTYALDGRTLHQLKEIDSLNRDAQESLQEMKGRSVAVYSLPTQISMPMIPNEEKYENEWRRAMNEPLPLYFNADGTRVAQTGIRSSSNSPRPPSQVTSRNVVAIPQPQTPSSQTRQPILSLVNQTAQFPEQPSQSQERVVEQRSPRPISQSRTETKKKEVTGNKSPPATSRNGSKNKGGIYTQYSERMSNYNKSTSPKSSQRKLYFDVKKELDVSRIEALLREVSPASQHELSPSHKHLLTSAKASTKSHMQELNEAELRRLLASMKKQGSKLDDKRQQGPYPVPQQTSKTPSPIGFVEDQTVLRQKKTTQTNFKSKPARQEQDTSIADASQSQTSFGIRLQRVTEEEQRAANNSSKRLTEMTRSAAAQPELHQEDKSIRGGQSSIPEEISVNGKSRQNDQSYISDRVVVTQEEPKDTVFLTQNINEDFEEESVD